MGNKTLIYRNKVEANLQESFKHLKRINSAFDKLEKRYNFPLNKQNFDILSDCIEDVAFSDQIIYRFSKLQDCMGAKLFKSLLLYQGENVNKPFLDILNQLERIDIINVENWFEMRDLRNEIAHEYEDNEEFAIHILNSIYDLRNELSAILNSVKKLTSKV